MKAALAKAVTVGVGVVQTEQPFPGAVREPWQQLDVPGDEYRGSLLFSTFSLSHPLQNVPVMSPLQH